MLKKIEVRLVYDGSGQGETDRDAHKAEWDVGLCQSAVVPSFYMGDQLIESAVSADGLTLSGKIFFSNSVEGVSEWSALWSQVQAAYAKGTVIKDGVTNSSFGNKHDCGWDTPGLGCRNYVQLS